MIKKINYILISFGIIIGFLPLVASAISHNAVLGQRGEIQEERDQFRKEIEERRNSFRTEIKDTLRGKIDEKRDAMKAEMDKLRKDFEARREALRQELEARRDEFRKKAEERKSELKKKVGEIRAERIEQFFNRMLDKFHAAFERLNKFADRIEKKIKRAQDNGKDVVDAQSKLLAAREKIADAEKALEDAKAKYTQAVADPDFKTAFKKVREIVQGVAAKLKEAHSALVDTITALKGISTEKEPSPDKSENGVENESERQVEITAAGFSPSTLKIKVGTTVRFINRDPDRPHWPASGVHPTHQICAGFDARKGLAKDESYSFTFTEAKTCPMHDHLNPAIKGTIIVE
jgi:plastocyanin